MAIAARLAAACADPRPPTPAVSTTTRPVASILRGRRTAAWVTASAVSAAPCSATADAWLITPSLPASDLRGGGSRNAPRASRPRRRSWPRRAVGSELRVVRDVGLVVRFGVLVHAERVVVVVDVVPVLV